MREADGVIAVSEHLRQTLIDNGISSSKVRVIRRGVDGSVFKPGDRAEARQRLGLPADAPIALWVGRMTPLKGLQVLLKAAMRLRETCPDLRFYLVGSGEQMTEIREEISRVALADRVNLVGAVQDAAAVANWYRAANVMVLPSFSEGVPNVLLESIACGTAFVASDVGGVAEIATPGLDRLTPPGDCGRLASEIFAAIKQSRTAGVTRSFVPYSSKVAAQKLIEAINTKIMPTDRDFESVQWSPASIS